MRRGLLALTAPLLFGAVVTAQQQIFFDDHQVLVRPAPVKEATQARLSPDEVVARMLTFDRDHDGKIAETELTERMQPLMARGDTNRDGTLDPVEIRTLASAPPAPPVHQGRGGFPFGGGSYGFADEDSFSSRNHIEGAIEDLKLAADTREQALSIAKVYVDRVEAEAEAELVKDLNGVLSPEQIMGLQESLKAQPKAVFTLRTREGVVTQHVVARSISIQPHINQFRLEPDKRRLAQEAANRYTARVKMSESERAAIVDQMKGILNSEERDNLRAALVRRPVVAKGGLAGIAGVQVHLMEMAVEKLDVKLFRGQEEPVFQRFEGHVLQPQGR